MTLAKELIEYIKKSTSSFHAVKESKEILEKNGYIRLWENKEWEIKSGGKYYVTRNSSSIIAFCIPERGFAPFKIVAAHSDSPGFKLKENAGLVASGKYAKLNTETYGGAILSSFFDRPLSIAGRVIVDTKQGLCEKLIDFDRDMALIPSLAIHLNREINDGYKYNKQVDMLPLWGIAENKEQAEQKFKDLLAKELGVEVSSIFGTDLYLYNRMAGTIWGEAEEFVSAPRLDDLACAFASILAQVSSKSETKINVCAIFDNEEVGSLSKQGADSTFLSDTLRRIARVFDVREEEYMAAIASSFMVSADNAHAVHPNHPEKTDENNHCFLNDGIVIKYNAAQNYTTDALSSAYFKKICDMASVPYQVYANRSDMAGGSTLGRLSIGHVSMNMLDIGIAQLAMHSSYETMGTKDLEYMVKALTVFFERDINIVG